MKKALLFAGLTMSLIACAAVSAPMAIAKGTPMLSPSRTAKPTLSPTPNASATSEPTRTPTEAPTDTPRPTPVLLLTIPFPWPYPTPATTIALDCKLIWQSPRNGVKYKPRQDFTVGWKVKNTGSAGWETDSIEFTYLGGAKLYDYPVVHLETGVTPGQEVVLSVDMRAPKNSTLYTTYWSLRSQDTFFCRLKLSIYVE